jgi:asparagine synthase (glutamine-hydrolysing)
MLVYSEGKIRVERYWDFPQPKTSVHLSEATEELAHLLEQAVGRQMVADVPVGAFLSGGLDSSSIVAMAAPLARRIKTFSFRFGAGKNELPYAREVAELFNTDHYETSDTAPDIGTLMLHMQNIYDEPFADSSNIATFLLAGFAREQVKVVLTGDGGDELFGGYAWYHTLHDFTKIPGPLRPAVRALAMGNRLAMRLAARAGVAVSPSWRRYGKILGNAGAARSVADLHWRQTAYFSDRELERLGLTIPPSPQALDQGEDPLDAALRMDLTNYMPGDILVKIDRAAMAHGLELRAPFLDVDLASYCIALPSRLKVSSGADKILLREMMGARLPGNVISREKQGFGAPVQEWLTRQRVQSLLQKHLDDPNDRLFSILPFDATRTYTARGGYHAWILLVLALWAATHQFEIGIAP